MRTSSGAAKYRINNPINATATAINVLSATPVDATRHRRSTNKVATIPTIRANNSRAAAPGSTPIVPRPAPWKRPASGPNGRSSSTKARDATVAIAPDLPPNPDAIGTAERVSSLATIKKVNPQTVDSKMNSVSVIVAETAGAPSLTERTVVMPAKVPA